VKLIEKNHHIRIKELVLDFLQDIEGKIWFVGCKKIDYDVTKTLQDYLAQDGEEGEKNSLG